LDKNVAAILRDHQFFVDVKELNKILELVKKACKAVEAKNTNLHSCFLQLVQLALAIRNLPVGLNQNFREECVLAFNKRWQQFDFDLYMLAYFFHPKYRGIKFKFICYINTIFLNKYLFYIR
jgi:hypothetical protein